MEIKNVKAFNIHPAEVLPKYFVWEGVFMQRNDNFNLETR